MFSVTPANTVGSMKYPLVPRRLPPVSNLAPSLLPLSISSRIFFNWVSSIRGPFCVLRLKGSPTTRFLASSTDLFTNSSYIPSCTYVLDPAQQICPMLDMIAS